MTRLTTARSQRQLLPLAPAFSSASSFVKLDSCRRRWKSVVSPLTFAHRNAMTPSAPSLFQPCPEPFIPPPPMQLQVLSVTNDELH